MRVVAGLSYEIRDGLLIFTLAEDYMPGMAIPVLEDLAADSGFPGPLPLLMDFRRVLHDPSTEQIKAAAPRLRLLAGRAFTRIAVIAPRDVQFGLARMAATYYEDTGVTYRVFRTEAEALKDLLDAVRTTY